MTITSPEPLALLGRAAELRASGFPWADAATQLAVDVQELRRLASEHARDYDRLMRRARTEVLRETLDAALAALRARLESREPGVSMRAATTIVRYELARIRNGQKEAASRLERDTKRSRRRETVTVNAENVRNENVPETAKVPTQQGVNAAKKSAQPNAPGASVTPPPAPPKPSPSEPPVAERNKTSVADAVRKNPLLDVFAVGRTSSPPLAKGTPQTLEVDRLMRGWLTEPGG